LAGGKVTGDSTSVSVKFECKKCGGKKIMLPDNPDDDSIVKCALCGLEFGRWGDIRKAARDKVSEEFKKELRQTIRNSFKNSKFIKVK
jgi:hypothetical protein